MAFPLVRAAPLPAFLLLAACATVSDPGWTGTGATPFGTAEGLCRSRAREMRNPDAREATFLVCMSEQGWTRKQPGAPG